MFKWIIQLWYQFHEWRKERRLRKIQTAWRKRNDDMLAHWGVEDSSQMHHK